MTTDINLPFLVYVAGTPTEPVVLPKGCYMSHSLEDSNVIFVCPDHLFDPKISDTLGRLDNNQRGVFTDVFPNHIVVRSNYALSVAVEYRNREKKAKAKAKKTGKIRTKREVLTEEEARYIKLIKFVPDRPSCRTLARMFSCAKDTILSIWQGKTWTCLDDEEIQ